MMVGALGSHMDVDTSHKEVDVFRFRVFLISALVALAGLAAAAPSASAQATLNEDASCMGILSSFVGADPLADIVAPGVSRSDFAPLPGEDVRTAAQLHGGSGLPILNCATTLGLP
jgi:hypothetical protein